MSDPNQNPVTTSEQEVFGPYVVLDRLGVGGMATVHRAKVKGIEGFERVVALKRLLPHLAEDASFVKSFVREAKLASMLQHANIVQLYELGRVGATYYISMEHIDGRDVRRMLLQARRAAGPPNINVTLSLLIQLCDALDYAHTRTDENGEPLGLVHRDVSPSNLLVTRSGHLKVIDFGIAKAQTQQLLTQDGKIKGKLAYMAPEAITGGTVDSRSDIFSAGVIAHELLTARALFASKSEYQTLINVQRSEILPPSAFNQAVPRELDEIVAKALARNPAQRYASAAEMRDDLHGVRTRYNLSATNREVETWCNWAFSIGRAGSFSDGTGSLSGMSQSRTPLPLPAAATGERMTMAARPPERSSEDDEAAAIAWGGAPDVSPAMVHELPDLAGRSGSFGSRPRTAPVATSSTSASFGDSIVAPRKGNPVVRAAAIAVGVAVVAGAGYMLISRGGAKAAASSAAMSTERAADAELAAVKFIVEPADATIKIAGMPAHVGAPWSVDLDPGVVQVKISHDGHQSWETSIELSKGEKQTIRVGLAEVEGDPSLATLVIGSQPAGLAIVLDGVETNQRTPWKTTLPSGAHTVQLRDASGAIAWKNAWMAEPRTLYEFNPAMTAARQQERVERERQALAQVTPRAARPAAARALDAGVAEPVAAVVTPPLAAMVAEPAKPSETKPAAAAPATVKPAALAPPAKAAPTRVATAVPAQPAPAVTAAPKVIAPNMAKRIAGDLPKLRTILRPGMEMPTSLAVKICINANGNVSTVQVLKVAGMNKDNREALKELTEAFSRAIRAWRYAPYKDNGVATPACFVNSFAVSK